MPDHISRKKIVTVVTNTEHKNKGHAMTKLKSEILIDIAM